MRRATLLTMKMMIGDGEARNSELACFPKAFLLLAVPGVGDGVIDDVDAGGEADGRCCQPIKRFISYILQRSC